MPATCYENAGAAKVKGFEIALSHKLDKHWAGFINYTYQNPLIKKALTAAEENKLVTAIPKKVLRAGITYNNGKWSGMLTGEYVSKRFSSTSNADIVNGVYGSYDPFFTVNLNVGYALNDHCTLTAAVNNLLNRDYFNYYYQPGRTYTLELSYKF